MEPDPDDPWGATTREIFEQLDRGLRNDDELALATVVGVDGSAYRRPGAKMVLDGAGMVYGGITAGCLEGPLQDIAARVLEQDRPAVETFDLTSDDNTWGLGLGCEGIVDVLVEPVDASWETPVTAYRDEARSIVITVLAGTASVPVGSRVILDSEHEVIPAGERAAIPADIRNDLVSIARDVVDAGDSHRRVDLGELELFVDLIEPATPVLLFGSQPDIRPVSRLATQLGMDVTVATPRGGQASADAFPHATRVVASRPTSIDELVDERSHVILMSHNFVDDRLALETLLETDVPYLGLMGPRDRFDRMRSELAEQGRSLSAEDRERIATPVGLDLGDGEPIEIATSIVAEILAVSNNRDGGRLRDRQGPIHERQHVPTRK